jgi:hypothetical protein
MSKIKLGSRPKNFSKVLEVTLHEGEKGTITVSYIYRTRTEFGAFVDKLMAAVPATLAAADAAASAEARYSLLADLTRSRDTQTDYILQICDGWDLDVPFSREAVRQLCDELPGAAAVVIDTYRAAITEGRLGN